MERPRLRAVVMVLLASATLASAADQPRDPLARARTLYNGGHFEAAIAAADEARGTASRADSADLVAARSYLERFRGSQASEDLTNARARLARLDPRKLGGREQTEYLVGLGEVLFFDEAFGAAADMFSDVLAHQSELPASGHERVLDWWATAVDRDARTRPEIDRQAVYQQVRDRMRDEIVTRPGSLAASYWLSAAACGQGDLQSAWNAAQAGWVRASLAGDGGTALRADLDNLVLQLLVPGRAKVLGQPVEALRQEWERFKESWARQ
jgi:hypothetical protein